MIRAISESTFIELDYKTGIGYTAKIYTDYLNTKDTYIAIFSKGDLEAKKEKAFLESGKFNILYKSERAVNTNPFHTKVPRNTLYIFELK